MAMTGVPEWRRRVEGEPRARGTSCSGLAWLAALSGAAVADVVNASCSRDGRPAIAFHGFTRCRCDEWIVSERSDAIAHRGLRDWTLTFVLGKGIPTLGRRKHKQRRDTAAWGSSTFSLTGNQSRQLELTHAVPMGASRPCTALASFAQARGLLLAQSRSSFLR